MADQKYIYNSAKATVGHSHGPHLDIDSKKNTIKHGGIAANEFENLGVESKRSLGIHFLNTVSDPETQHFQAPRNFDFYYNKNDNTLVVHNRNDLSKTTIYRPGNNKIGYDNSNYGQQWFLEKLKNAEKEAIAGGHPAPKLTTIEKLNEVSPSSYHHNFIPIKETLKTHGALAGINAVTSYAGYKEAEARGDKVGEGVAAANGIVGLSSATLAIVKSLGKPIAIGLEKTVVGAGGITTVATGAYLVSQEKDHEHKVERGAVVATSAIVSTDVAGLLGAGVMGTVVAPVAVGIAAYKFGDSLIELKDAIKPLYSHAQIPNKAFNQQTSFADYPNMNVAGWESKEAAQLSSNPKLASQGIKNIQDPAWLRQELTAQTKTYSVNDKHSFEDYIVPTDNAVKFGQAKAGLAELDDYEKKFDTQLKLNEAAKNLTAKGGAIKDSGRSDPAKQNWEVNNVRESQLQARGI